MSFGYEVKTQSHFVLNCLSVLSNYLFIAFSLSLILLNLGDEYHVPFCSEYNFNFYITSVALPQILRSSYKNAFPNIFVNSFRISYIICLKRNCFQYKISVNVAVFVIQQKYKRITNALFITVCIIYCCNIV